MAKHRRKNAKPVKQRKTNHFNMLPDEILLIVFSHVVDTKRGQMEMTRLGRVCRRFRRISQDKQFWKNVSLAQTRITGRELASMITIYEEIKNLDLSGSVVTLPIDFPAKAKKRHFIKKLDTLNLSKFSSMNNFDVNFCKMLEILKPKRLIANNATVSWEDILRNSFSQSRQLEAVSMESLKFFSPSILKFKDIFSKCNKLRELNLSNSKLSQLQLLNLCNLPRNVEKFMLNNVNLGEQYLDIFERIVTFVPKLKYLGVSLMYLTKPEVVAILNRHKNLESLRLYHNEWSRVRSLAKWKPRVFVDILEQLTNVKKIHFVMEKGALGKVHKSRIPKQVAMLKKHLNADGLHIGIEFDIFKCDWELRLNKPC